LSFGVRGSLRGWRALHHGRSSSTRAGGTGEWVRRATREQGHPHLLVTVGRHAPTPSDPSVVVSTESAAVGPAPPTDLSPEQVLPPGSRDEVVVSRQVMLWPPTELTPAEASPRSMDRSSGEVVRRFADDPARELPTGQAAPRAWPEVPLARLRFAWDGLSLVRVVPPRGIAMTPPGSIRWPEWSTPVQRLGLVSAGGSLPLAVTRVEADQGGVENLAPSRSMRRSDVPALPRRPAEPPALQEAPHEVAPETALPVATDTVGHVAVRRTVDSSMLRVSADLPSPLGRPFPLGTGAQVRDVEAATAVPSAPVDLDELVEKAWQTLMRRLTIEQERRGYTRWP
jgi:hypothetical protein